jgi:hypothetical protein
LQTGHSIAPISHSGVSNFFLLLPLFAVALPRQAKQVCE